MRFSHLCTGGKSVGSGQIGAPGAFLDSEEKDLVRKIIHAAADDFAKLDFAEIQSLVSKLEARQRGLEQQIEDLEREKEQWVEQKSRFADLFYEGPVGYFVLDKDGRLQDANPSGYALLGATKRQDIRNESFQKFLCPSSVRAFTLHLNEVSRTLKPMVCEVRLRPLYDQQRVLELRSIAWLDSRYEVYCRMIATDITSRQKSEITAQKTLALLDRAFSSDPDLLQKYSPELKALLEEDKGLESLAHARTRAQYEHFVEERFSHLTERLLRADLDTTQMAFEIRDFAVALTGSQYGYVSEIDPVSLENVSPTLTQMIGQDCRMDEGASNAFPREENGYPGIWGHCLNTLRPFFTNTPEEHPAWKGSAPKGHVPIRRFLSAPATASGVAYGQIALANAAVDYTEEDLRIVQRLANLFALAVERRQRETQLAKSEAQLHAIYQHLPLPTAVWRVGNPDFQFLFKNQAAQRLILSRKTSAEQLANALLAPHPQILQVMEKARGCAEPLLQEIKIAGESTDALYLELRCVFVEPDLLILHAEDISARKLAEEKLRLAKQASEEASKAKNEFLASMSHEVRTPLNGVLGMLQLLQTEPLSEEQEEFLEAAISSGTSLLTVISDILDFSKIEAGKISLSEESFKPLELLKGVKNVLEVQAHERGLTLELTMDPNLPPHLLGDPGRLRQILYNLIGNAIKFTPAGKVSVVSELIEVNQGRAQVQFCVEDQGIGIAKQRVEDIFNPFVQIDGAYQRRTQGSGLGLSIVKRLVNLMGGFIAVDSEEGQGSRFVVTLPFTVGNHDDPDDDQAQEPQSVRSEGRRVLVAEDNAVSRMMVSRMLERLGHEVQVVENGVQALELLANHPFDFVLMDVQMPLLDGIECTRIIRSGERAGIDAGIRIVALTAHNMKGDREKFLQAGMDDYLSKPIFFKDLKQVFEKDH